MVSPHELLRKQYGKAPKPLSILAGASHFRDAWSRDAFFACHGALAQGDHQIVHDTLHLFLDHLRDGHVPLRIGRMSEVLAYIDFPGPEGVIHRQDKGINLAYDENALLLVAADAYERVTRDKLPRDKLREVANWLVRHLNEDGLLHEGPYASWEDSVKHRGTRLYTNVCAYRGMMAASRLLNDKQYEKRATRIKLVIQTWWSGQYFRDGPRNPACMTAGNLLAITWGVATRAQAKHILAYVGRRTSVCPPAGFWKPGFKDVYWPFFALGLADYHSAMEWSWLGAIEIAAYRVVGNNAEADLREKSMLFLIHRDGTLYEVFKHDKPLRRLIYRTEKDFAWALGLLVASSKKSVHILR